MTLNDLLYESMNRDLNPDEQDRLDQALANDPALQAERNALLKLHVAMKDQKQSIPISVADDVIASLEIDSKPLRIGLNQWFPRVAAACLLIILAMILQVYVQNGSLSTDSLMGIQDLEIYDAYSLTFEENK